MGSAGMTGNTGTSSESCFSESLAGATVVVEGGDGVGAGADG